MSQNYYKSSFFMPKLSEIIFSSLTFKKTFWFLSFYLCLLVCVLHGIQSDNAVSNLDYTILFKKIWTCGDMNLWPIIIGTVESHLLKAKHTSHSLNWPSLPRALLENPKSSIHETPTPKPTQQQPQPATIICESKPTTPNCLDA